MKKNASFPQILLLILLCLAIPLSSAKAEPQGVATVVAIRGTVIAQNKSGASRNLSIKSQIFQEDMLKTDKNGQLQIMFTDSTIISVGRDSEMKIAEYRWQPDKKDGALKTEVKEGTFRVMGGALAKEAPQNFKTVTPTATIGIRGSMYAFKSTRETLSVLFQGGKGIDIFNDLGKVTITTPGFGTQVVLNTAPAKPTKFTEQELNNLNQQLNGNGSNGEQSTAAPSAEGEPAAGAEPAPGPEPETTLEPVPPKPIIVDYREIIWTFPPPPPPPSDGIFAFSGGVGGTSTKSDGSSKTFSNNLEMGVNWHNHKIFGAAYDDTVEKSKPVFFFGTVNGTTVSDLRIFGSDEGGGTYPNTQAAFISGSGAGLFSGTAYDFFSFNATGSSYLTAGTPTQPALDSWIVAGGGQQVAGAMIPEAPKGTDHWEGFVVAASENMNDRPTGRHLIYNTTPDKFTMDINRDTGTISGTLAANVTVGGGSAITGMTVGGAYGSVYINDQHLAALLGGSNLAVKEYGNYLVVAAQENQLSTYFTWGYWEVAYEESPNQRQIRVPESMWLAGKPTTNSVINGTFTGTYSGKAFGTMIDTTDTTKISQISGTMNLTANFTSTPSITGSLAFTNGPTLSISGGTYSASPSSNRFDATLTGGTIQGTFYGDNAEAVGGNFYSLTGGKQYLGIFGGNK